MNGVMEGKVRVGAAPELMGVSERHTWHLLAAYRRDGVAAVVHGNKGRKPMSKTNTHHRLLVSGIMVLSGKKMRNRIQLISEGTETT